MPDFCNFHELKDGTYTIDDLADMHEVMDVREENQYRARVAAKAKAEKG